MTWTDVGNAWRNLFLLSCALQAAALGTLFAKRRWFAKKSRLACFFTGVAATPFVQYLWTLALAFVLPLASKWIYIGALPALAGGYLLTLLVRNRKRLKPLCARGWAFVRRACRFDKPALVSLCFALCLAILVLPVCVRFSISMSSVAGGDAGEYMALGQNFCEEREIGTLLEKEETVGHFRGHSHFPSLELYMSYGLFHTGVDCYGYPNDKPVFAATGLLAFYMAAAYLALLLVMCRERKRWILLGALLLNLVPNLEASIASAPRDIWRIIALLWAALFFVGFQPLGGWKRYVGKLALCFAVCFTVMSAHVVCFVVLPFIVIAWVVWRWLEALLANEKRAGRTLAASVGLALSGAAGTLLAFSGNLWCYFRWGEMSPWRLMTTYTDAPWYDIYMKIEYRLEEAMHHLNFWQAKDDILVSYATPIGVWGWRFALVALACTLTYLIVKRVKSRQRTVNVPADHRAELCSTALCCTLITLCTLAPMTGLVDTRLYSFSGAFLKLPRYTLQWFMLANVMTCCALATLEDIWGDLCALAKRKASGLYARVRALKCGDSAVALTRRAPAYLCALLCAFSFVRGTDQTGYTYSFVRYSRGVMEDESLLMDNGFQEEYATLLAVADAVRDDQKILITRVGYQYALHARGYCLTSNPIVPLLNLPLSQVEGALREMNVAVIASQPEFWDERYYALSTLNEYLQTLPEEQIVDNGKMRLYLIDPALVSAVPSTSATGESD